MNAASAPPAVEARSLRKAFAGQQVLNAIDLTVAQGQTLAVLGQSGTGKSVLLKLIVGLQQPDAGSIRIHGQDIAAMGRPGLQAARKKIGFLFQSAALYDSMTVEDNVAFPLKRHSSGTAGEQRSQVQQLLVSVGMEKDSNKMPDQISGGMQKRVGLARALALSPDILLLDEPTSGLDPITATEITRLILKMQKERKVAAIIVTHDVQVAREVADRMALMRDGNILIAGSYADLCASQDRFVKEFLKPAL